MRAILIVIGLAFSGCASPGYIVPGLQSERVTVGAYEFKVNYTRSVAEAYRVNFVLRPKTAAVFPAASEAMETVSGCKVVSSSLSGDVARITADLLC